jgi:hypothetical protein
MSYKYPACGTCYFHNREEAICDGCIDEDEYESDDTEDSGVSQAIADLNMEIAA